jgi:hypothetical protein
MWAIAILLHKTTRLIRSKSKQKMAQRIEIERRGDSAEKTRLLEELQIVGDNTDGDNLTYAKTPEGDSGFTQLRKSPGIMEQIYLMS